MKEKVIDWAIFIILSLIWGSSFLLMKVGMEVLSPYQVAAIRMLSSGLVLLPFAAKAIRQIPKNKIKVVLLSGVLGSFFPAFLFCLAETKIDSALAGILNALTPLFTILIGATFFKIKVHLQRYIGVIVGFIGLTLLFLAKSNISLTYFWFASLVIIATIFYAINVNLIMKHLQQVGSLKIAAMAFSFLIIPSAIILFATGYFSDAVGRPGFITSSAASIVLGVFGTAVASILFYVLVKRAGGLFASTVTYGIPFVAVFWGILSGESITLLQIGCLGIILAGVFIANKPAS